MKILNSSPLSSFGGLSFVLNEINQCDFDSSFNRFLPGLPAQSKYSWKDILYSFWSIFFCGGDCIEDLSANLKEAFNYNPLVTRPSPDRVLERMKQLSEPKVFFNTPRGGKRHGISFNSRLNKLNIILLKKLRLINQQPNILDYDNTIIFTSKEDAANTYKHKTGYYPGVGFIGSNIVYVENRNGNTDAQTLQQKSLQRMFNLLKSNEINIDVFRADSASYQLSTLSVISKNVNKFYIRARMNESLNEAICKIEDWKEINIGEQTLYRGETNFIPFEKIAKRNKQEHLLNQYRLIVTKEIRKDGQFNLFTGEACNYSTILTNDSEMTADQVVCFYNQRGAIEREFDVLKNDFGWKNIPFSKLEYNTVFLLLTAICRNLYNYIIHKFSNMFKGLSPHFRIKKFIFRFICVPAKWIRTGRTYTLRVYGNLYFKT